MVRFLYRSAPVLLALLLFFSAITPSCAQSIAMCSWALNRTITLNGGYEMLNFNVDHGSTF
jgi:hypothetical protein